MTLRSIAGNGFVGWGGRGIENVRIVSNAFARFAGIADIADNGAEKAMRIAELAADLT